jgi:serine phosphatase RsbU (regulator of sigma subunit)
MIGLRYREKANEPLRIAASCNNLGLCFYEQDQFDQSILYYKRCQEILLNENDTICELYSSAMNNTGLSLMELDLHEQALPYFTRSIAIDHQSGSRYSESFGYNYLGDTYSHLKQYEKAFVYYEHGKSISEEVNDPYGIQMANVSIANAFIDQGDPTLSIDLLLDAASYYSLIDGISEREEVMNSLAIAYKKMGQWKKAFTYLDTAKQLSIALHKSDFTETMANIQGKYDFDRQNAEITLFAKERELRKAELLQGKEKERNQYLFIWVIAIALAAALFMLILIALSLSRKRKDNQKISNQKKEVEKQRDIAEEQTQIAHSRSLEIAEKHQEITDSINYGKRIQEALLTSAAYWNRVSEKRFILFEPKDIVSGDFYWAYTNNETTYWVVADCTGHGVPGAFMSMLGIGFLNEIIIENGITDTSEILNALRNKIIKALDNEDQDIKQRDGMDISLCKWNKSTNQLDYSGANNSLWIIRNLQNTQASDLQRVFKINETDEIGLLETVADKQPVGSYGDELKSFTTKTLELLPGDRVYGFTDGYADQFGGEKGKKLKPKTLKTILVESYSSEMSVQKELLLVSLEKWKRDFEQVDDICIIGIEV